MPLQFCYPLHVLPTVYVMCIECSTHRENINAMQYIQEADSQAPTISQKHDFVLFVGQVLVVPFHLASLLGLD